MLDWIAACTGAILESESEMNLAIEMHDSECLAVEVDEEGRGSVLLDAYVHRTFGKPGVSSGEGGVQRIRMTIDAMTVAGNVGMLPSEIYEGSLAIGNFLQDNMVPFPAVHVGTFRLSMMLSTDARVVLVSGNKISIEAEGEFRFIENFDFTGR